MSLALSQPRQQHLFTDQESLYHSVFDQLGALVPNHVDKHSISRTVVDILNSPRPCDKPIRIQGQCKIFKATVFNSPEKSESHIYINKVKTPDEKKRVKTKHNAKSFSECAHVILRSNYLFVEKAGLLKFSLKNAGLKADFDHELRLLELIRQMPQVTHLQNSKIYERSGKNGKEAKGLIFIDYYERGDLEKFISSSFNALSPREHFSLFRSMLTALVDLNEKEIIHNDLNPSNILLGKLLNIALADFEFSLSKEDCLDEEKFKAFTVNKGTIALCSPERFKFIYNNGESEKPGLPSNVWSIGCIMSYMLQQEWPLVCQHLFTYHGNLRKIEKCAKHSKTPENENKIKALCDNEQENKKRLELTLMRMEHYLNQNPKQRGILGLIKGLLHPDPLKRLTANEALKRFDALSPNDFLNVSDKDYIGYLKSNAK